MKPIVAPEGKKNVNFIVLKRLQAQFSIVRGPARFWDQEMLWYIMTACIIMHNMIIQDERGQNVVYGTYEFMVHPVRARRGGDRIQRFLDAYHDIRYVDVHIDLQKDLMEEWWAWYGRQRARPSTRFFMCLYVMKLVVV